MPSLARGIVAASVRRMTIRAADLSAFSDGERSYDPTAALLAGIEGRDGTIAGRYRVERLIGIGTSGFVVAARHVYLRHAVTLKILRSARALDTGKDQLATTHRVSALQSRHIARIIDTGALSDGSPFIASEYLEGRSLSDELALRTKLPTQEAIVWILQACEALAEAHAAGIVHGDLKPQNLFLALPDPPTLKVLDFGMSTPVDDPDDNSHILWSASPAYLAPEQILDPGHPDPRADIWALGVILCELVSGAVPFVADSISGTLVAVAYDEPSLPSADDAPAALRRILRACLSKDPAARPQDIATLAHALASFAGRKGSRLAARVEDAVRRGATAPTPPERTTNIDELELDATPVTPAPPSPPPAPPPPVSDTDAVAAADELPVHLPMEQRWSERAGVAAAVVAVAAGAILGVPSLVLRSAEDTMPASTELTSADMPRVIVGPTPARPTSASAPEQAAQPVPEPAPVSSIAAPRGRPRKDPLPPLPTRTPRSILIRDDPYTPYAPHMPHMPHAKGFTHPRRLERRD